MLCCCDLRVHKIFLFPMEINIIMLDVLSDVVWLDSIRGLFLLFLAILANFLGPTMNCSFQKRMQDNALWRNIAVYGLIYFTINFTSQGDSHPFILFGYAFLVYVLYLLLIRQSLIGVSVGLFCIFLIFVAAQVIAHYRKKKDNDSENIATCDRWIHASTVFIRVVSCVLLISLTIGFLLYAKKQKKDHPFNFDWTVFLFGSNTCDALKHSRK